MASQADKDNWVRQVLGVVVAEPTGGAALPGKGRAADPGGGLQAALAGWDTRRSEVIATLKSLESAIRGMRDPLSDPAIILVKAIAANLTAVPDSKNSVAELRRYLDTDDIIVEAEHPNGFGIDVKIRQPLDEALTALEHALGA
jgi:hypothetical protein